MNSSEIENLIRDFFDTVNRRQYDRLKRFFSPDIVFHFPGTRPLNGPTKLVQMLKIIHHRYSKLIFIVVDIIVQGDRAVALWDNHGTDTHGSPYQNEGATVFTFVKGKIQYLSDYFKDTSFVK